MKCYLFLRELDLKLIEEIRNKLEIVGIIFSEKRESQLKGIPFYSHEEFEKNVKNNNLKVDYIFSYYYQKKLSSEILKSALKGAINIHPAPLPYYRGVGTYSLAILEELKFWGCSAHYMDEEYDNGEIIEVKTFPIDSLKETYDSLEKKTKIYSYNLLIQVVENIISSRGLNRKKEIIDFKQIKYISRKKINELKKITESDNLEMIEKKIRAFWKPPFSGATIMLKGKEFTIVNEEILKIILESKEL